MARNFLALNPSNQFNYYNAYGYYNAVGGGVGGNQTANFADGKSVEQMERFSNVYYNLLGFDYRLDAEYSNSEGTNTVNLSSSGTCSFNGLTEIYVAAPWIGDGNTNSLGYKVSPYGDDQGDPFIRYAWNAKGGVQQQFLDFYDDSGTARLEADGACFFREGNDVTPGNGQRNLHFGTISGNIKGAMTTTNGPICLHWRNVSGTPFRFIKMGIVFCGGVDQMSYKVLGSFSSDFKAHSSYIADVPCYVVSYVEGFSDDESGDDGYTYSTSLLRVGANEARTIKFSDESFTPGFTTNDGEQIPSFSDESSVRLKITGLRWSNYE